MIFLIMYNFQLLLPVIGINIQFLPAFILMSFGLVSCIILFLRQKDYIYYFK